MTILQNITSEKVQLMKIVHEALFKENYFGFTNDDAKEKILVFLSIEVGKANWYQNKNTFEEKAKRLFETGR